jgi:hypothetical protein
VRKTTRTRVFASLLLALTLVLSLTSTAFAATVTNETFPLSGFLFNPCTGELLQFTGQGHDTFRVTFDSAGGEHIGGHFNVQGIKAVGLSTGINYVGTEADNNQFNFGFTKGAAEETQVSNFTAISQGSAPNFVVHFLFHITVNANGDITSFVDNFSAECRG